MRTSTARGSRLGPRQESFSAKRSGPERGQTARTAGSAAAPPGDGAGREWPPGAPDCRPRANRLLVSWCLCWDTLLAPQTQHVRIGTPNETSSWAAHLGDITVSRQPGVRQTTVPFQVLAQMPPPFDSPGSLRCPFSYGPSGAYTGTMKLLRVPWSHRCGQTSSVAAVSGSPRSEITVSAELVPSTALGRICSSLSSGVWGGHDPWCSLACSCITLTSASVSTWPSPHGGLLGQGSLWVDPEGNILFFRRAASSLPRMKTYQLTR
ncbi:uncharacterized protein LOC132367372 isoform X2 [Balaenoptera ricei]|uniref:uncharacterized protein LOC132367372 isoform X2 n=1 Tax=Balaenoptera ricei TaxID=2746895 RepID=UPI0028BD43C1|nr:uncharacterized protein LOC132367372 isoform X2 [Balaenoptera ricei]